MDIEAVSTHSRPKAADDNFVLATISGGFNTQPPEGGCKAEAEAWAAKIVSTHSRPKAAGQPRKKADALGVVSTHSRPKAADLRLVLAHGGL